jgi:ABC-type transport system involved in multi-copper enzyme maturation permease subunit
MATFVIARLTFFEASRRKILWAALALGLIFLALFGLGFHEIQKDITRNSPSSLMNLSEIYNFILMAGLYVVNFLTVMMSVLTAVDTLSGEIASGTIQTLLSKPVRRWEILLGKWLGYIGMLTLYLLLMASGVMALVYLISSYSPPHAWRGLGLMWLNSLLLLNATLLGGSSLSTLANGVLVFGLYGIAFIGGWMEQFGSLLENQAAVNIGIFSSLLMPAEALWRRAAFEMQSPLVTAMGFSPFTSGTSVPSPLMIVYAVLFAGISLAVAIYLFGKRDM